MKKFLIVTAIFLGLVVPTSASPWITGTYEPFPDKSESFNLTITDDYFDIGRPLQCVPIKKSVKIDQTDTVHFDAKCHGANRDSGSSINHEKWHFTKAENGDVYLVMIYEDARNTQVEIWKLRK
jgi:hypothetical protein